MNKDDFGSKYANTMYKYIHNDMPVETYMAKFNLNHAELNGLIELFRVNGKSVKIEEENGTLVFKKISTKSSSLNRLGIDKSKIIHTQIGLVSDTHFGNIGQQLHLLNLIYREAYNRGITQMYHLGDVVDGFYPNRKENPKYQFLNGFDEQSNFVIYEYPEIEGITTSFLEGSHDETHYKNGGATLHNAISISRRSKDLKFIGQDFGIVNIGKIQFFFDHPGDGKSRTKSYTLQKRAEVISEDGYTPQFYAVGHYHGSYYMDYLNMTCMMIPAFCTKTHFQHKKAIFNDVGAYFLDIYSDEKGNIIFVEPEEILFHQEDFWDEAGKDKNKVKKLVIKNTVY